MLARQWWRNIKKCSRSLIVVSILVVGLVLLKDRYDRLDELMPAQLPGEGSDDPEDGYIAQLPASVVRMLPAEEMVQPRPAAKPEPSLAEPLEPRQPQVLEKLQEAQVRPDPGEQPEEQHPRERQPQEQQPQEQQPPEWQSPEWQPQEQQPQEQMQEQQLQEQQPQDQQPQERQPQESQPRESKQQEWQPQEQESQERQVPTTTVVAAKAGASPPRAKDTEPTKMLRKGLGTWLLRVATFQQMEVLDALRRWFKREDVQKVKAKLDALLKQDNSSGWGTCGIEDERCLCPTGKIRYGHVERGWISKTGKKDIWCTLQTFDGRDIAVGMLKECQCWQPLDEAAGTSDLRKLAGVADEGGAETRSLWQRIVSSILPTPTSKPPEPHPPDHPPSGSLWGVVGVVAHWIEAEASAEQLGAAARVYKWMENTRAASAVALAIAGASARNTRCPNGLPPMKKRCPGDGEPTCRAGCRKESPLSSAEKRSAPTPRSELCPDGVVLEMLWSCEKAVSRLPRDGHPHSQPQLVLDMASKRICGDARMRTQLTVFLDCDFVDTYRRWTTDESEWLEEAYVTYVGGSKDSQYQWQATNLVRSVDVFSSRPIVVVVFGDEFVPPASWQTLHNVIVFRMYPGLPAVSFNFNKLRSMVSSRVVVGIQLDTDQLIAPGMDRLFQGTRREITDRYPWIMLPVHWMSREGTRPDPYWEYAFRGWEGPRSMRWGHAHPTWSYWALAFLGDLLFERFSATGGRSLGGDSVHWDLQAARSRGLLQVFKEGKTIKRPNRLAQFMAEDEDMFNVGLWRDTARKDWCKFDLEWGLFKDRLQLDSNLYWDRKWYPQGLPVVFISMHNTKQFEQTDWFLSLLAKCDKERPKLSCPPTKHAPRYCEAGSGEERGLRHQPAKYVPSLCCCFEPRQQTAVYWGGRWFSLTESVPTKLAGFKKDRTCLLP
mmetsp:Transcript_68155/g.197566  ORF Transcript_68155/g.197566 Transcript_68155/m.197566 type:complete len:941 (+) Transcript_68155:120-2942(+)